MPLIDYCNLLVYVQRQTDRLLRFFKKFVKDYVDNIVIFLRILLEHISYLRQVFALFKRIEVILKSFKSFLEYLNVQLLGQRVDFFRLSTSAKRLTVINKLRFSIILSALETYLDITKYLRNYIAWYV